MGSRVIGLWGRGERGGSRGQWVWGNGGSRGSWDRRADGGGGVLGVRGVGFLGERRIAGVGVAGIMGSRGDIYQISIHKNKVYTSGGIYKHQVHFGENKCL